MFLLFLFAVCVPLRLLVSYFFRDFRRVRVGICVRQFVACEGERVWGGNEGVATRRLFLRTVLSRTAAAGDGTARPSRSWRIPTCPLREPGCGAPTRMGTIEFASSSGVSGRRGACENTRWNKNLERTSVRWGRETAHRTKAECAIPAGGGGLTPRAHVPRWWGRRLQRAAGCGLTELPVLAFSDRSSVETLKRNEGSRRSVDTICGTGV